jgi:hypothetical protein
MTPTPVDTPPGQQQPLAQARRRGDACRSTTQSPNRSGAEITVSSIARAARVHRRFIHRHPDLHAAVLAAAAVPAEPAANNGAISVASLRADLLNTRAHNTRLQQHIRALENRLSEKASARPSFAIVASEHPTTSAASSRRSPTASNNSSSYAANSRTATMSWPRPAQPIVS